MPDPTPFTLSEGAAKIASLLILEDDAALNGRLCQSMRARGYDPKPAASLADARQILEDNAPAFAVVDMRLPDGSGLDFMSTLSKRAPDCRAVVLTGYGNIPTAVSAIGAGAFDFLAKPADADEIHNALQAKRHDEVAIPYQPATSERVRREHIEAVYEQFNRNVSETARRLGMHRRTLQRILGKNPPR